jgi:hypothetical protein
MNAASFPVWTVRARNISVNAENRIHDDAGARRLGFAGGLVSGVTVYSYLMRPLLERFGEEALAGATSRAAFFQPVYEGELLTIETTAGIPANPEPAVSARALREDGEAVAVLEWTRPRALPVPETPPAFDPLPAGAERPPFSWEAVVPGRAFHGFAWRPGADDNRRWCESVEGALPLFQNGERPPLHPGLVLQQTNQTLTREFRMEPWIHVSSRIVARAALRTGDEIEVRAVPVERWEKAGDRFARLRVALVRAGRPALEVDHKTIVQVAPRQAASSPPTS